MYLKKILCCFCKKEISVNESHDIRPIKTNNGDIFEYNRCCLECNNNIVAPTRISVWGYEDELKKQLIKLKECVQEFKEHIKK